MTKRLQTVAPVTPSIAFAPSCAEVEENFEPPVRDEHPEQTSQLQTDDIAPDIPKLGRQLTAPNDETTEQQSTVDNIDPMDSNSQESISDVFSSGDETIRGDDAFEEQNSNNNPRSPTRRQHSGDRVPQLLTSLQKKLLMVRQTSLEVSETFDRLSSPSKKSQHRLNHPNSLLALEDMEQEGTLLDNELPGDVTTPYRPIALFHDLKDEVNDSDLDLLATNRVGNVQESPVVVLFDDQSAKSPFPSQNPSSIIPSTPIDTHTPYSTPQQKESRISQSSKASCESDLSTQVLKEGFLMKRGFVNKAFQRRWCVLKGKDIFYYKQYRDKDVRGKINCAQATVIRAENRKDELPFAFYVHTPRDRYNLIYIL